MGYPAAQETGPKGQNHNSFYVVAPKNARKHAPLCVVLHSANRTAFDYLGFQFLNRTIDRGDDPGSVMTRTPAGCYTLFLNSTNAEWWGWTMLRRNPAKYKTALAPPEKRVFNTIEWVVTHYGIDRNRIYLAGVSMGGCGTLGLGVPHGDIFAAVLADVPAGTEFMAFRRGFPPPLPLGASPAERDQWLKAVSGVGLPDPPVLIDFSSQIDNWSKTQPALVDSAVAGRLPLVLSWGPFGHTTFANKIVKYPQSAVALDFPWLEIRKNAAYPVFTSASSDQRAPWLGDPASFDESGQINAYFRWKNQTDATSQFKMQLWIAHPTLQNPPASMPDTSTANVTFRRLQRFRVHAGTKYAWRMVRNGTLLSSGTIEPDAAGLLTIPGVTLTTTPATLSLKGLN